MKRVTGITALLFFCIGGLKLGASLSSDGFSLAMGVIYGSLIGVPAALIAATARKTIHHEHVHRVIAAQPTTAITQYPQRLIVVNEHQQLMASVSNKLEVLK